MLVKLSLKKKRKKKINLKKRPIKELSLLSLLSLKKKQEKTQEKNNQRIVPIVSIVFKKTPGAELRIISLSFKKHKEQRQETSLLSLKTARSES